MPFPDEAEYFGLRATASQRASDAAADVSSRIVHAQLAMRYQALSERHEARRAVAAWTNEGGHV